MADGGRLQQRRPHLASDGRLQVDAQVLLVELVGVLEPLEGGGGRRLGNVLSLLLEAVLQVGLQRPKAVLEGRLVDRGDDPGLHHVPAPLGVEAVQGRQAVALHADQLRELLGWGQLPHVGQ